MLSSLSFAAAALLKRRFEQTLPLAFFLIILLCYLSGLWGWVTPGVWLVWLLSAAALVFSLWAAARRKVSLFGQLITPGWAVFAVIFFGFWVAQTGRRPIAYDDFSHWALLPKNMYFIGGFGNGPGASTVFREYPPALALLEFFSSRPAARFARTCSTARTRCFSARCNSRCFGRSPGSARGTRCCSCPSCWRCR
jgi:hypothetical protein